MGQKKMEIKKLTFQNLIDFMESEVEVCEMADRDFGTNRLFKKHEERSQHENADEESLCTATAMHIKPVQICTFCRTSMSVEDRFQKRPRLVSEVLCLVIMLQTASGRNGVPVVVSIYHSFVQVPDHLHI